MSLKLCAIPNTVVGVENKNGVAYTLFGTNPTEPAEAEPNTGLKYLSVCALDVIETNACLNPTPLEMFVILHLGLTVILGIL